MQYLQQLFPISVGFPLRKILNLAHQIKLCVHSFFLKYRFAPKCSHAQESLTCQFLRFHFYLCLICRTMVCWDAEILIPWQRDVISSLFHCILRGIKQFKISCVKRGKTNINLKSVYIFHNTCVKTTLFYFESFPSFPFVIWGPAYDFLLHTTWRRRC